MLRSTLPLLALAFATVAAAQTSSPTTITPATPIGAHPAQMAPTLATFDDMDRNRDGFVARDEVPVTHDIARAWTILDENLDNRLAREEFVAYNPDERLD